MLLADSKSTMHSTAAFARTTVAPSTAAKAMAMETMAMESMAMETDSIDIVTTQEATDYGGYAVILF